MKTFICRVVLLVPCLLFVSAVSAGEPMEDETGYFAQASERWSSVSTEPKLFMPVSELPESDLQQRGRFYYLYLFPSKLAPSTLRPEICQKFREWDDAIWRERQLRAENGGRYDLAESVCAKAGKWLGAEQWDAAELFGTTLSDQRCLTVEKDGEGLDVVYGLPISYEAWKQTPMYRTKRLYHMTLKFHSMEDFWFRDWKIKNATFLVDVPESCDLRGARLENVEIRNPSADQPFFSTAADEEKNLKTDDSKASKDDSSEAALKNESAEVADDVVRKTPQKTSSNNHLSSSSNAIRQYYYFIYPTQDVADESLKEIAKIWNNLLEDFKKKFDSDKRLIGDYPGDEAGYTIGKICKNDPTWFIPEESWSWDDVDLRGCCIRFDSCREYHYEGNEGWYSYGIPITFSELQRTKTWREKHMVDIEFSVGKRASRDHLSEIYRHPTMLDSFSFKGWLIENSSIYVGGKETIIDFSDATLLNVDLHGDDNFNKLKQFVVTRNVELGNVDDIDIIITKAELDAPFLRSDWLCDGVFCLSEKSLSEEKRKIELPQWLSSDQIVASVLDNSIKSDKEVFFGIKPKDLYSTEAYHRGDLRNVTFFPERIKGVYYSLKGWNLSNLDLTGACFDGLDLSDVDFTDSIITGASFRGVRGLTLEQLSKTRNWKEKQMDDVALPNRMDDAVFKYFEE